MNPAPGKVVIISGPSGAGKSTVLDRLLDECELPLVMSVSATTRAPRAGERDGVHYHFLSQDEFARRRQAGEFLECMEVFGRGDWYGTLASEVSSGLEAGKWVILEIDVDGALAVLETYPDAITIFLHPGSMQELERRLRSRGTESEQSLRRRLEVAQREMTFLDRYRHEVVNDNVAAAVKRICDILEHT
jgi:guanylate kinase